MNRVFTCALICSVFLGTAFAQNNDSSAPASSADVAAYFEAVHSRQMMGQMMQAMSKSMHQMIHDMYLKDKDKLPPDFEAQATKHLDDMWNNMPWDEMMQAMMPVYQKHFTKGDIAALLAFYNSLTGQKMLQELPAIMGESMEAMMPIMERYMESVKKQINDEFAEALKRSDKKAD